MVGAGPVGLATAHLLASARPSEPRRRAARRPAAPPRRTRGQRSHASRSSARPGSTWRRIDVARQGPRRCGPRQLRDHAQRPAHRSPPVRTSGPRGARVHADPAAQHLAAPSRTAPRRASAAELAACDLRYRTRVGVERAGRRRRHLRRCETSTVVRCSRSGVATSSQPTVRAAAFASRSGIDMVGPPSLQSFIAIHFNADLRAMIADRLGVLHFVMDPGRHGRVHRPRHRPRVGVHGELRPHRRDARRLRPRPLRRHRAERPRRRRGRPRRGRASAPGT